MDKDITLKDLEDGASDVIAYINDYEQQKQLTLALIFLKALAQLTQEQATDGIPIEKIEFSAVEIRDRMEQISEKTIRGERDPGGYIGRRFQGLDKHLKGSLEIQNIVKKNEHRFVARPHKKEGGGSGNKTYYRLVLNKVESEAVSDEEKHPVPADGLRYEATHSLPPWWTRWIHEKNIRSWKLALFLMVILFPAVVVMLVGFLPLLAFVHPPLALTAASWIGMLILPAIVVFLLACPFYRVIDKRVAMAPDWVNFFQFHEFLMEFRPDRDESGKIRNRQIHFVKYKGQCPVCSGRVHIQRGWWQFPGRLVGRCWENPAEHVFSFDHVTRTGKPLR
ncbi:hypothetical protein [Sansalvadorimonas verongulae]|uniref:hypothetical protein n=1 Tax=Sansalvadorimonas verongulae TaxID=2172824 RepID=UPI0012BD0B7B|nr:hypothetical protein [Sansalvadorimonas verongulae]MTI12311.1 hypothetical protein [Sansalvadorimonas verongulae]